MKVHEKGLYKTQAGKAMELANPPRKEVPGATDNSSCSRC